MAIHRTKNPSLSFGTTGPRNPGRRPTTRSVTRHVPKAFPMLAELPESYPWHPANPRENWFALGDVLGTVLARCQPPETVD